MSVLRRTGTMEQTAQEAKELLSNNALWRLPRELPSSSPTAKNTKRKMPPSKRSPTKKTTTGPAKKIVKSSTPKVTKPVAQKISTFSSSSSSVPPISVIPAYVIPPVDKNALIASFANPAGVPPVGIDVVFSFDTTASMNQCLNTVREKVAEMVGHLLTDLPTIRIGVLTHGDYEHNPVSRRFDLSRSKDEIIDFVKKVPAAGGGHDTAEAYELALKKCLNKMSWNENHAKALVVIGDTYPHAPEESKNRKKIDWRVQLTGLAAKGVKVYAVQCSAKVKTTNFFATLAAQTGGSHLLLKDLQLIRDMFMGVCYREGYEMEIAQNCERYDGVLEELQKEMESLGVEGGVSKLLRPDETKEAINVESDDMMRIHRAVHDSSEEDVEVGGIKYPVTFGASGCRYVRINEHGLLFIQQNIERATKFAQMAREGKKITWICKKGKWGVIIDDTIDKKLED